MTIPSLAVLAQIALAVAGLALALWCAVLARRLRQLNDLERGLGGAIAVMASEIARLEHALTRARSDATAAGEALGQTVAQARDERARWDLIAAQAPGATAPRIRRLRRGADAAH